MGDHKVISQYFCFLIEYHLAQFNILFARAVKGILRLNQPTTPEFWSLKEAYWLLNSANSALITNAFLFDASNRFINLLDHVVVSVSRVGLSPHLIEGVLQFAIGRLLVAGFAAKRGRLT